jgi:hypothetical protein
LLSKKLAHDRRVMIGWTLVAIGALSTIPLAVGVAKRVRADRPNGRPGESREGLVAD